MTADDDNFSRKLTGYLDQGTADLKAGTVYRLQNARAAAVARLADPVGVHASESRLAHAFAGTGAQGASGGRNLLTSARLWLGIGIIVAAAFGYQQWQAYQQVNEIVELDAQILSSDLPIDAYLDQGFRNWLTRDEN
jgi:uncharacterized protein involved in tellurium resistance